MHEGRVAEDAGAGDQGIMFGYATNEPLPTKLKGHVVVCAIRDMSMHNLKYFLQRMWFRRDVAPTAPARTARRLVKLRPPDTSRLRRDSVGGTGGAREANDRGTARASGSTVCTERDDACENLNIADARAGLNDDDGWAHRDDRW